MASIVQNNRQKNERHCIRCVWCVLFGSFSNDDGDDNESVIKAIECFHMTSWRPHWCPKTMKRRPCWSPRLILWELNSFLMQTLSFVPVNCVDAGHVSENAPQVYWATLQICTCITLFLFISVITAMMWKCLNSRFMEDVNKRRRIFLSLCKLNISAVRMKSTPGKFACILHFKRIGINAEKLKKREFIFKVTFSLPSPSSMIWRLQMSEGVIHPPRSITPSSVISRILQIILGLFQ